MLAMKKLLFVPLLLLALLMIHSCSKEIKVCTAEVKQLNDSTSLITRIGDYEINFDIRKARFTNGAVMSGDSVRINYVGDLTERKATAVIVHLIPKPGNVVNAGYDPSKELKTKPMTEEKRQQLDNFVRTVKEQRNR